MYNVHPPTPEKELCLCIEIYQNFKTKCIKIQHIKRFRRKHYSKIKNCFSAKWKLLAIESNFSGNMFTVLNEKIDKDDKQICMC